MASRIFQLGKNVVIYGIGSVLGRFLAIILLPLYTNYFQTNEYGIIANVYAYILFATVIFRFGLEEAYMRFAVEGDSDNKNKTVSTAFNALILLSFLLSGLVFTFASEISPFVGVPVGQSIILKYTAAILLFDTLSVIPLASLRMENRATVFSSIRVLDVVMNIGGNILFIVYFKWGIAGVFLANITSAALTLLFSSAITFRKLLSGIDTRLLRQMLKFAIPAIPMGLANVAQQVIDRPIVRALTDDATLGVYQANYRIGMAMMIVVAIVDYAWRPFFLQRAGDDDAKQLFSRVFTYLVSVMCFIFLIVSFFAEDLVRVQIGAHYLVHPDYWQGLVIVPIVLFAYVILGMYDNFVVGAYIRQRSDYLAYTTVAGAGANIIMNFVLIPSYGIVGAACATLIGTTVMAVMMYIIARSLYPVSYEWKKVIIMGIFTSICFMIYRISGLIPMDLFSIAIKSGLLFVFVAVMFSAGVLNSKQLKSSVQKLMKGTSKN
jgi:O-antigen/teichoic acid export membrane protein